MFSEKTTPRIARPRNDSVSGLTRCPVNARWGRLGFWDGKTLKAELHSNASRVLPRRFYHRETATVARSLLGKVLRVRDRRIWRSGVIVETEAYVSNDPANHAYRGPNRRNESMFHEPGTVYVYPIHQVHCVNVVTRRGEAVLIRALEALNNVASSTSGPGRLCRALKITRTKHDGLSFTGSKIQIIKQDYGPFEIGVSKRIGISKAKEMPLRFFAKDNPHVSR